MAGALSYIAATPRRTDWDGRVGGGWRRGSQPRLLTPLDLTPFPPLYLHLDFFWLAPLLFVSVLFFCLILFLSLRPYCSIWVFVPIFFANNRCVNQGYKSWFLQGGGRFPYCFRSKGRSPSKNSSNFISPFNGFVSDCTNWTPYRVGRKFINDQGHAVLQHASSTRNGVFFICSNPRWFLTKLERIYWLKRVYQLESRDTWTIPLGEMWHFFGLSR